MDKEELEKQIRKEIIAVHSNISLSPIEKQRMVMDLMATLYKHSMSANTTNNTNSTNTISNTTISNTTTSNTTTSNTTTSNTTTSNTTTSNTMISNTMISNTTISNTTISNTTEPSEIDMEINKKNVIESECSHYERLCLVECPFPSCRKYVKCRLCHDSIITDHQLDRFSICKVMCITCGEIQKVSNECKKCHVVFAKYYCDVCHLFENNPQKEIFHCKQCGICRIGNSESYVHCSKCNLCINKEVYNNHKCFVNTWNDCSVCMEELKISVKQLFLLSCGHGIHVECLKTLLTSDYRCPLCKKSIGDMSHAWERMTSDLNQMRGNIQIDLITCAGEAIKKTCICNDCEKMFEVNRNVFNMYSCPECKSFNSS
jgi:RING finger and CHY zinc finger domain-containing protein 1